MNLSQLKDFNLVASHGGFGKAGRASHRSKATLSRRVARLETDLGIRLIERDSHAFRLTEAGAALSTRIAPLLAEVNDIVAEIADDTRAPQGVLRVSAPVLFSQLFLGPLVADFHALYPQIQIEATTEDRLVDMVEEGYDAIIRVNPEPTTDLVGRIFTRDQYVVVTPPTLEIPDYARDISLPAVLLTTPVIETPWHIEERTVQPKPVIRLPSLSMVRDAAVHGAGVAALPLSLVQRDIQAGRLINEGLLKDGAVDLWVLHTSRRLASSKVRAFIDFLSDRLS